MLVLNFWKVAIYRFILKEEIVPYPRLACRLFHCQQKHCLCGVTFLLTGQQKHLQRTHIFTLLFQLNRACSVSQTKIATKQTGAWHDLKLLSFYEQFRISFKPQYFFKKCFLNEISNGLAAYSLIWAGESKQVKKKVTLCFTWTRNYSDLYEGCLVKSGRSSC